MKLRSIALAGLLGSALLMTSGCSKDDVIDAINNALKTNVIYIANANVVDGFTVEGSLDSVEAKTVAKNSSKIFVVEGQDSYTVNNDAKHAPKEFVKDSAHLYALCANDSVLTDTATTEARQIEILNLSNDPISAGDGDFLVTLYDGDDEVLAEMALEEHTLAACAKELLLEPTQPFNLSDVKRVDVSGVSYNVPPYDTKVGDALDKLNGVDFDIIIFDPTSGAVEATIIPLATAVELGQASN